MSDMDVIPRFEFMILEGAEDFVISVDKCPKVGRAQLVVPLGCISNRKCRRSQGASYLSCT